jgi:hypothetical protein
MTSSGVLTAAQVIRLECRFCTRTAQAKCTTKVCNLHHGVSELRSSVKKIKAHCMGCAAQDIGETRFEAIATCTGHLLRENGNTARWTDADGLERGVCFLHPYRLGKNPTRRRMSPETRAKRSEVLAKHRPRHCKRGPYSSVGSTVSSSAIAVGGR